MTKYPRHPILTTVLLASALGLLTPVTSVQADHSTGLIEPERRDTVAIDGYDPVAYYLMGRAVKGSENFSHTWLDVNWNFVSEEHRDLFANDPLCYAPQYGGYCSDATLSHGTINPTAFRIVKNRLYLFYLEENADNWVNDSDALSEAEAAWAEVKPGLSP